LISLAFINAGCITLPSPRNVNNQPAVSAAVSATRINLNTASAHELESLPGIGATMASRIVAHRDRYGPYRRTEHLMMVRGISDRKFRALQSLISVD
jgi:competence protein ComEA